MTEQTKQGELFEARQRLITHRRRSGKSADFRLQVRAALDCFRPMTRDSILKARAKERQISGLKKGDEIPVLSIGRERGDPSDWTDHKLAKMAGVGTATIHRDAIIKARAKERMIAGKVYPSYQGNGGRESGNTNDILGAMAGTSGKTIHEIRTIEREADAETKGHPPSWVLEKRGKRAGM